MPAPAPHRPLARFVLTRAATGTEPLLLGVAGVALVVAAIVTGDADWPPAAFAAVAFAVSSVAVFASGGGPRRRVLDGVDRFLPADAVELRSEGVTVLRRGVPLLLVLVPWSLAGSPLAGGAFGLGVGVSLWLDLHLVRRWEREHGARLAYEHWSWSYRLAHLFHVPEHVGVRS